jgi:hypothetical protein
MTDLGTSFRGSEDIPTLHERAAAALAAARKAAERYVQLRRKAQATLGQTREILAETARLRDDLRDSVTRYVLMLRGAAVPPERAVILVKNAVFESDGYPDSHHREVVEEAVRWAVDAYYAA